MDVQSVGVQPATAECATSGHRPMARLPSAISSCHRAIVPSITSHLPSPVSRLPSLGTCRVVSSSACACTCRRESPSAPIYRYFKLDSHVTVCRSPSALGPVAAPLYKRTGRRVGAAGNFLSAGSCLAQGRNPLSSSNVPCPWPLALALTL